MRIVCPRLAAAAITLAGVAGAAPAAAGERASIELGRLVEPPAGYVAMCAATPELCPAPAAPSTPLETALLALGAASASASVNAAAGAIAPLAAVAMPLPFVAFPAPAPKAAEAAGTIETPPLARADARHRKPLNLLRRINGVVNGGVMQRRDIDTTGEDDEWRPSGVGPGAVGDCEDIALEKRQRLLDAGFDPDRLRLAVVYSRAAGLHTVLVAGTERGDFVLDNRRRAVLPWKQTRYTWVAMQARYASNEWRTVI